MKKRIFSLFMVFTLCFVNVNQVYADAGSLIIAGGSIAGGVTAGAVAGPAVVAVFCAMMAFGMNVELTQASEEAGLTKTEFLKNKIVEYCNEAQISANTFNQYILDQSNVFQNGVISLTNQASNLIQKFCNWLFESENVNAPTADIFDLDYIYSADGRFMNSSNRYGYYTEDGSSCNCIQFLLDGNYKLLFFRPKEQGTFVLKGKGNYGNEFSVQSYGISENFTCVFCDVNVGAVAGSNVQFDTVPYNGEITWDEMLDLMRINDSNIGDTITGDQNIYDISKGVLNPTADQTIVINPNITIPVPSDKDVTIDVNEYLDIIQDLIDGLADDVITAIDDVTGVPIVIEFDPTQDWDPTIEKEDDTDLPPDDEKTPVVNDDIIPSDFDPDPMKFDLKGIFPFCIPWDVKDMLSKLSADPVAPSYTVNWLVPIVNERLIFTVDLSPFNGVAQVCRTMEVLAFCIGLAIVTRQLFLRG